MWANLCIGLYESGDEQRFKLVWARAGDWLIENVEKTKFRFDGYDELFPSLSRTDWDEVKDQIQRETKRKQKAQLQRALEWQFFAYLWRQSFDEASACLRLWSDVESNDIGSTVLSSELSVLLRSQQLENTPYAITRLDFGTWGMGRDKLHKVAFWLLVHGQVSLLVQLAQLPGLLSYAIDGLAWLALFAGDLVTLAGLSTHAEFSQWIGDRKSDDARAIGAAYAAFSLARQGKNGSASMIVRDTSPYLNTSNLREWVSLAHAQGLALSAGVEAARHQIQSNDALLYVDQSADLWAVACVLTMTGQGEAALELLREATYDLGRDDAWITWAGVQSRVLSPVELASKIPPVARDIGARLAMNLAAVDFEYGRAFLQEWYSQSRPTLERPLLSIWSRQQQRSINGSSEGPSSPPSSSDGVNADETMGLLDSLYRWLVDDLSAFSYDGIYFSKCLFDLTDELTCWIAGAHVTLPNFLVDVADAIAAIDLGIEASADDEAPLLVSARKWHRRVKLCTMLFHRAPALCSEYLADCASSASQQIQTLLDRRDVYADSFAGLALSLVWGIAKSGKERLAFSTLQKLVQIAESPDIPISSSLLEYSGMCEIIIAAPQSEIAVKLLNKVLQEIQDVGCLLQLLLYFVQHKDVDRARAIMDCVMATISSVGLYSKFSTFDVSTAEERYGNSVIDDIAKRLLTQEHNATGNIHSIGEDDAIPEDHLPVGAGMLEWVSIHFMLLGHDEWAAQIINQLPFDCDEYILLRSLSEKGIDSPVGLFLISSFYRNFTGWNISRGYVRDIRGYFQPDITWLTDAIVRSASGVSSRDDLWCLASAIETLPRFFRQVDMFVACADQFSEEVVARLIDELSGTDQPDDLLVKATWLGAIASAIAKRSPSRGTEPEASALLSSAVKLLSDLGTENGRQFRLTSVLGMYIGGEISAEIASVWGLAILLRCATADTLSDKLREIEVEFLTKLYVELRRAQWDNEVFMSSLFGVLDTLGGQEVLSVIDGMLPLGPRRRAVVT